MQDLFSFSCFDYQYLVIYKNACNFEKDIDLVCINKFSLVIIFMIVLYFALFQKLMHSKSTFFPNDMMVVIDPIRMFTSIATPAIKTSYFKQPANCFQFLIHEETSITQLKVKVNIEKIKSKLIKTSNFKGSMNFSYLLPTC